MLKIKQKFGIKKLSIGVASVFMGLVGIYGTSVADASGENYKYITHKDSDLTEKGLAQINKTILDNSTLECGDTVHFVYKDKNGNTVTVDKEVLKADEKVESVVAKVLPNTNVAKSLVSVIGVIVFGGLTLALVRNKKTRKLLIVVLVATGLGVSGTNASAGENVPFNTLVTVDKAEQVVVPEYEGYEYVGYYVEKGFCSLEVINVTEDGTKITDGAEQNKDMYTFVKENVDPKTGQVTKVYHKIVTNYVDENNKIIETIDGKEVAPKEIDKYTHISTVIEEDGDIIHKYKKIPDNVNISYVDEKGNHVDKINAENPNKYVVVSEKDKGNGNIERTVHKIVTKYVDNKTGATIEEVNGKVTEHKEIPNYTYITTETLDNGDIVHKYNKTSKVKYVTPEGEDISNTDDADFEDEYTLIEEKQDSDGDTIRVMHKITTNYIDEKGNTIEKVNKKVPNHKEIEGYNYVTTETKENGDIVHKYSKTPTIVYTDENGDNLTPENALDSTKYTPVRENVDKDKNTITKVYHKITTTYKEDTGKVIETADRKEIAPKVVDGYTHTNTTVEDDGDVVHTYSKIPNNPTIIYVNKVGESVPKVDAENPNKYTVVEEKNKENGDIERVVHKIVTKYIDNKTGTTIEEVEDKVTEHKEIPNYTYTTTELLDNGDIVHKYNKVPKIKYVTPEGEEIPDTDGADFEDEYKIIEERIGDSGETIRVAHKITTTYIDEKGDTIEKVNKKVPNHKEIPNYTYLTTEIATNGDVVHKYSKNPTIVYVDEENTPITKENAENPELYTFVEDKEDNDPETETKVYHKIVTKYVDGKTGQDIKDKVNGKNDEKPTIDGYTYSTTDTASNGDVVHKYTKNPTIVYVDEENTPITKENAENPELYTIVEDKEDNNPETETKVYHKIVTKYIDNNTQAEIKEKVNGKNNERPTIDGYKYTTTDILSNGDIIHKYNKIPEDRYVTTTGETITKEEAETDRYEKVREETDGNTSGKTYVYKLLPNIVYVNEEGNTPITKEDAENPEMYTFVSEDFNTNNNTLTKTYRRVTQPTENDYTEHREAKTTRLVIRHVDEDENDITDIVNANEPKPQNDNNSSSATATFRVNNRTGEVTDINIETTGPSPMEEWSSFETDEFIYVRNSDDARNVYHTNFNVTAEVTNDGNVVFKTGGLPYVEELVETRIWHKQSKEPIALPIEDDVADV